MSDFKFLFQHLGFENSPVRIVGGDINEVCAGVLKGQKVVIKINDSTNFPKMFELESQGLNLLSSHIATPEIMEVGSFENLQYLILNEIQTAPTTPQFWIEFGAQLASLHEVTNIDFGLDDNNYIGSLIQDNTSYGNWTKFLIERRLSPMIEMAVNAGEVNYVEAKIIEKLYTKLPEIIPTEKPALLHGDLWSGNFLSGKSGAILIDPAVYFGHREMDLAMMHLFGGFHESLFDSYINIAPLEPGWKSRIEINQLYPLLVHLNLFGRSYWNQIHKILTPFA